MVNPQNGKERAHRRSFRDQLAQRSSQNIQRYLTGYPWIVIAADKGGTLRYHCAICRRCATMTHIPMDSHTERVFHDFTASLRGYIPAWMARFQSVNTRVGNLFNADEYDLWPPVRYERNANLTDPSSSRCSNCQPSTMPISANAGDDSDEVPFAEPGKRFRPTDANKDAGSMATSKAKLTPKRSEYRDFREKGRASGSGQSDTRREALLRNGLRTRALQKKTSRTRSGFAGSTGPTAMPRRASTPKGVRAGP